MSNIYLKSADERTVVKLSNPHDEPEISPHYVEKGYKVIDYAEFKKVRAKIQRGWRQKAFKSEGVKVESQKCLLQK